MTIYVGDIIEGIDTLQTIVEGLGDIDSAPQSKVAHAIASAKTLTEAIDDAVARVDARVPSEDALGLAKGLSGAFAPDMAAELLAQRDLVEQGIILLDLRAYSGRIFVNLGVRG